MLHHIRIPFHRPGRDRGHHKTIPPKERETTKSRSAVLHTRGMHRSQDTGKQSLNPSEFPPIPDPRSPSPAPRNLVMSIVLFSHRRRSPGASRPRQPENPRSPGQKRNGMKPRTKPMMPVTSATPITPVTSATPRPLQPSRRQHLQDHAALPLTRPRQMNGFGRAWHLRWARHKRSTNQEGGVGRMPTSVHDPDCGYHNPP